MNNMYGAYNMDPSGYSLELEGNSPNSAANAAMYQQQAHQYAASGMPSIPVAGPSSAYAPTAPTTRSSRMRSDVHSGMQGVRKRYSPDNLIGLDEPTQPRRYVTPSSTSRKEIPSMYLKGRRTSQPSDDEDDELTEEPPAANATDQEKIEWKRRQNTLAARRSRKRKMLYTQQLEETVERLRIEREMWRTRALTLKQLLSSHGLPVPDFKD